MNQTIKITGIDGADRLWGYSNSTKTMKRLEESFRFAIAAGEQVRAHRAKLDGKQEYLPAGLIAETQRYAVSDVLPGISRGRLAVKQARAQLQGRRTKIKPPAPDQRDLVSYFRRKEFRDEFRKSHPTCARRDQYLKDHGADLDVEDVMAILEAKDLPGTPELFISAQTRADLLRNAVAPEHRAERDVLDEMEEAIAATAEVVESGREKVRIELDMAPMEFEAIAAPVERAEASKTPPVWLRQSGDRVIVVVPNGVERTASADELEAGTYFKSFEEYQAAAAAA